MDLGVAAMVIAIPSLSALHLRLNEVDLRRSSYSFLRRCLTAAKTEMSLRCARVEKELQKMRVAFFHERGRFAVHFTFLLMLAMAVNFVYDPSLRAFSSVLFWTLLYSYFAIFHSLNMIEAPAGWQVSCFYVLFLHLFLVSNHWYWSALDLTESKLDVSALIPSERFHAVSLTLICCTMFDSKLTVPWCCFHAALQFCKSWQRFGLAQCLSSSVLCQEISVQFLTIMPIIAIEKLVRLKIEAVLETQDESSLVSGFRHVLRGVCDGDILLNSSYKILEDGSSLDRLLGHPKGTATGTSLVNLFTVDDCKRFVQFIATSANNAPSMPRGFRVTMKGRQGPVAMDLFHVPIRGQGFRGCNHLLAIKQDADQVIPDAPLEARGAPGVPSCLKKGSSVVSSKSSRKSGHKELTRYYSNLQEATFLLTSHSAMWDVAEVHLKFQRQKSLDPTMPTLRNFTKPTDWERISGKIQHVIENRSTKEKAAFKHPVWFRMPGESSKYLSARNVSVGHVKKPPVVEGNPILLWMNLRQFDLSQVPAGLEQVDESSDCFDC